MTYLGITYLYADRLDKAETVNRTALGVCTAAGEHFYRAYTLWQGGLVAWRTGDPDLGTSMVKASLQIRREAGQLFPAALCIEALAWIASDQEPVRAAALFGGADSLWRAMGTHLTVMPHHQDSRDHSEMIARSLITNTEYRQAYVSGSRLTGLQAIEFALGDELLPEGGDDEPPPTAIHWEGLGTLTKREMDVAKLLCARQSNRDIAMGLVISKRTVDTHVQSSLAASTRADPASRS